MENSWTAQTIHVVDFEGSVTSGILEYGVVTLHAGGVASLRTRLCRATGRIRTEDVAVHGLDDGVLAGQAPFSEEFELFAGLRSGGPLAAHFAGAEHSLIKSVWPYARTVPDFARPGKTTMEWGPWIDTGALYRQFYPHLPSFKLAEIVTACGLQAEVDAWATQHCPEARRHYHAAPYDALASAALLLSLAREPRIAALSTAQLLAFSTLDGDKRDAIQQGSLF